MDVSGNSISEKDFQQIRMELEALKDEPLEKIQRNLRVLGLITYLCEQVNIRPILVGGHAVEIYTGGHYTTVDIDLVLSGYDAVQNILSNIGFQKKNKHWYHETLMIPLEIPDSVLAGSMEKVIKIRTHGDLYIYCIGIEDIILDRLRAAVYWNSTRDSEWADILLATYVAKIDMQYLEETALQEPTKDVYNLFLELTQKNDQSSSED